MKNLELSAYGVEEMTAKEVKNTTGGGIWLWLAAVAVMAVVSWVSGGKGSLTVNQDGERHEMPLW